MDTSQIIIVNVLFDLMLIFWNIRAESMDREAVAHPTPLVLAIGTVLLVLLAIVEFRDKLVELYKEGSLKF